jgi:DNA-binding NtrC family response regulator
MRSHEGLQRPESQRATGHTVLLVYDDPAVLDGLMRVLRKEPYHVRTATSVAEAAEVLRSSSVDVVICDERMPGSSGTEFLARVAKDHPNIVRMILTGHVSPAVWQRAINDADIFRILGKPCNELELTMTIRRALKQGGDQR